MNLGEDEHWTNKLTIYSRLYQEFHELQILYIDKPLPSFVLFTLLIYKLSPGLKADFSIVI